MWMSVRDTHINTPQTNQTRNTHIHVADTDLKAHVPIRGGVPQAQLRTSRIVHRRLRAFLPHQLYPFQLLPPKGRRLRRGGGGFRLWLCFGLRLGLGLAGRPCLCCCLLGAAASARPPPRRLGRSGSISSGRFIILCLCIRCRLARHRPQDRGAHVQCGRLLLVVIVRGKPPHDLVVQAAHGTAADPGEAATTKRKSVHK